MSDEEKVVNQEQPDQAPSALETAIASSPEVEAEAQKLPESQSESAEQAVTQETATQQEEGRIPYSRFKEKVDEANWYKQQLEGVIQQRQQQLNVMQPTQDPYANMAAEERVFWQNIDKRIEERANRIADEKVGQLRPIIDAGRMEIAQSKVVEFRRNHPDIKPNSPEESDIADKINMGYRPDDAYWAVVGPRGFKAAEQQAKQQVKKTIEAKKLANVENKPSVPIEQYSQNSSQFTVPKTASEREDIARQRKLKFRSDFDKKLRESGF